MPRIRWTPNRALASPLLALMMAGSASAQYYSGASNPPPSGSQAFAKGLAGSGQPQGPINFSYSPAYGGGGGYGWLGGYGGGEGPTQQVATPWSSQYGAWIHQTPSYWGADDIARQQATIQGKMSYQDIELRRLQLKRAAFDEMRYEKMNTPPPEVEREEQRLQSLARARNTPPQDEISSGVALNVLLENIQRIQARDNIAGPSVPIDADTVKHINVTTTGGNAGSNEFFKPGGFQDWPQALSDDAFKDDRTAMQSTLSDLAQAQNNGRVDNAAVSKARRLSDTIKARLYDLRAKVPFGDYVAALEFLSKLNDTIGILSKPGAKNFLDGAYAAKGNNIHELASYMINKGLKFAQVTPGFEPYYATLYQLLVTYDIGLARMLGQGQDQMMMRGNLPPPAKE